MDIYDIIVAEEVKNSRSEMVEKIHPQPAARGTFCLRLPPELLAQVRLAAWAEKKSANSWIAQAIREKLEKSKPLIAP